MVLWHFVHCYACFKIECHIFQNAVLFNDLRFSGLLALLIVINYQSVVLKPPVTFFCYPVSVRAVLFVDHGVWYKDSHIVLALFNSVISICWCSFVLFGILLTFVEQAHKQQLPSMWCYQESHTLRSNLISRFLALHWLIVKPTVYLCRFQ